jgi:tetratricopeptide (TPR) repeat protein
MKKATLLLFISLLLLACLATTAWWITPRPGADTEVLTVAQSLYLAGHYAEAAQIYEQLAAQGVQDSGLFYNLGNAYYQLGDLAQAIVSYERAAQLAPRDPDVRTNLALARSQVASTPPAGADGPLASLANLTAGWLTLNETALLALGAWFLLALLLLVGRMARPGRGQRLLRAAAGLALLLLLFTGVSLAGRLYVEHTRPGGVVAVPLVAALSEPVDGS